MRRNVVGFLIAVVCGGALLIAPAVGYAAVYHTTDTTPNFRISLTELLRVIQFFNVGGLSCEEGTEDGYAPVAGGDETCGPHDSDYEPQDWKVNLTELLRLIQIFNSGGYGLDVTTEDGYKPISGSPPPEETPVDQLGIVVEQLKEWPDDLDSGAGDRLRELMDELGDTYLGGDSCGAADVLDAAIGEDIFTPGSGPSRAARASMETAAFTDLLYMRLRNLQYDIVLEAAETDPCPGRERFGQESEAEVGGSDPEGLMAKIRFGAPRFAPTAPPGPVLGRNLFGQVNVPGFPGQSGEPGQPWIPSVRHIVAVPPGAFVSLSTETTAGETFALSVAPFQQQPVDQAVPEDPEFPGPELFADRPFTLDEKLYSSDADYPRGPAQVTRLGLFRRLELVQVEIFAGQYNPVQEKMSLFGEVNFSLTFSNGPNGFLYDFADNPFESSPGVYLGAVLNRAAVEVAPRIPWEIVQQLAGEEFMIITHPDFRAAADALAAWKNEKGIMTRVFEAGTGSGITGRQTADEIDNFIEAHYNLVTTKPTYILLLGDAEFIPPFQIQRVGADPGVTIGTDWPYAVWDPPGTEFLPLAPMFALGRIPVDTQAQAQAVVDKIIAYESTPPGTNFSDPFYRRVMIASQFQCCRTDTTQIGRAQRTFAEVSEFVRAALVNNGYTVDRIYQITVDGGCASCDPPRPAYTADPTPRRYYDGTLLPAAIGAGSGFAWNGSTADVRNAWNQGRFLILHRDHGWPLGWGHPPFDTGSLSGLTNGAFQPVVFSINCSSGLWDNETSPGAEGTWSNGTYFAERLLRDPVNGAIGIIGDTRVSPSWPNSALTRGLFDAVWPNTVSSFGSAVSHRRLGDILNHGKLYLLSQVGISGQGTSYADAMNMLMLYHVIGDPTLEMWTEDPTKQLLPLNFSFLGFGQTTLNIAYAADGAQVTAYKTGPDQGLIPIGRGIVVDGEAQLELVQNPGPGDLFLAASAENFVTRAGLVEIPDPTHGK